MKTISCLLLIVGLLGTFTQAQAAAFSVGTAAELINAIDTANANGQDDTITLTADIVLTAVHNTIAGANGLPVIVADGGSSLTIDGSGFTIRRSGAAAFRIMHIAAGADVTLNNIRIENGLASAGGLGTLGGGVYAAGTVRIENSEFVGNTATTVGGLGAAIFVHGADFFLTSSRFTGNNAASGAAVYQYQNTGTLIGNTFSGNTSTFGGALADEYSNTTLINNTISGNTATSGPGGGIYRLGGSSVMTNNTITNNTASSSGGGIYNFLGGTITLRNNIIAGNTAPSNAECMNDTIIGGTVMTANAHNVLGVNGNAGGCPAGATDIVPSGAIGTVLAPLTDNGGPAFTHALVTGSPALDAANLAHCPSTDQRGFLRGFDATGVPNIPQLGDCDVGAFEFSLDPAYDSNPAAGGTFNLGSTWVGTEISAVLEIIETGSAALLVSLDSITGPNAADFRIIGLPTTIGNTNPPQAIAVLCSPSAGGTRTARLIFNTNDPAQPTVNYDVQCTGIDNVVASASIAGINQIVTEGSVAVTVTVELDVPTGFSSSADVTVEVVDAASGNAISSADYAAFAPTTLTFVGPLTPGTATTQTVTVNMLDDSVIEGAEYLSLQIQSVAGSAEIGPNSSQTIIINDDDDTFAQASFAANSAIIDEDAGTLSVDVQLFIPVGFNQTGDVTLTVSDALLGNATRDVDYRAFSPFSLTFVNAPFVAGTTYRQTISVPILDDTLLEGVETFELAITGVGGPVELVSPAAFTAIINDDEITTVVGAQVGTGGGAPVSGDVEFVFKTVDNPFPFVGDMVTYTIRARNPKAIPLSQVSIYDVFDERLTDLNLISTTHGIGRFYANTLIVSGFSLQPAEEAVIVVSARVASLRAGEIIPNAAILESPDASVHVSNLALIGDTPEGSTGGAAQILVLPDRLPNAGETPHWRWGVLGGAALLLAAGACWLWRQRPRLLP